MRVFGDAKRKDLCAVGTAFVNTESEFL